MSKSQDSQANQEKLQRILAKFNSQKNHENQDPPTMRPQKKLKIKGPL